MFLILRIYNIDAITADRLITDIAARLNVTTSVTLNLQRSI